jgi:hypothetical protein
VCCLLVRGFALCMQSDVFVEIAGVSEGTEAILALQWFVSSVGPVKGDSMVYLTKYNSMEHIPSEAHSHSASQEYPQFL